MLSQALSSGASAQIRDMAIACRNLRIIEKASGVVAKLHGARAEAGGAVLIAALQLLHATRYTSCMASYGPLTPVSQRSAAA